MPSAEGPSPALGTAATVTVRWWVVAIVTGRNFAEIFPDTIGYLR